MGSLIEAPVERDSVQKHVLISPVESSIRGKPRPLIFHLCAHADASKRLFWTRA